MTLAIKYKEISGLHNHCLYLALGCALHCSPAQVAALLHHTIRHHPAFNTNEKFHAISGRSMDDYFKDRWTLDLEWGGDTELHVLSKAFSNRVVFHLLSINSDSTIKDMELTYPESRDIGENIIHICFHYTSASGEGADTNHFNLIYSSVISNDYRSGDRTYFTDEEYKSQPIQESIKQCLLTHSVERKAKTQRNANWRPGLHLNWRHRVDADGMLPLPSWLEGC